MLDAGTTSIGRSGLAASTHRVPIFSITVHRGHRKSASSKERIDAAKEDWKSGRFDKVFGDEQEFIPLPEK